MRIGLVTRDAQVNKGEDPEDLFPVRKKPFDSSCIDTIPMNNRQLGAIQSICSCWLSWRRWKSDGPPAMAYDHLQADFLNVTELDTSNLCEYTIQDITYCINHALSEAGPPIGLLWKKNRRSIWYQRYQSLLEPSVLEYWESQEVEFLVRKRKYDSDPNPIEKDDPWICFEDGRCWAFWPERDLPAAYLVLGTVFDSSTLSSTFRSSAVFEAYPDFTAAREIVRADGKRYRPVISLAPEDVAPFYEKLWVQIELDLRRNGILDVKIGSPAAAGKNLARHKTIWDDIPEEWQKHIESYWGYAEEQYNNKKRPSIDKFCHKGDLDRQTLRDFLGQIRTRKQRGWATS